MLILANDLSPDLIIPGENDAILTRDMLSLLWSDSILASVMQFLDVARNAVTVFQRTSTCGNDVTTDDVIRYSSSSPLDAQGLIGQIVTI